MKASKNGGHIYQTDIDLTVRIMFNPISWFQGWLLSFNHSFHLFALRFLFITIVLTKTDFVKFDDETGLAINPEKAA